MTRKKLTVRVDDATHKRIVKRYETAHQFIQSLGEKTKYSLNDHIIALIDLPVEQGRRKGKANG